MKTNLWAVLVVVVLLAGGVMADTFNDIITWTFDDVSDLDDFDHTSGVTVGSDASGSWVDLESTSSSFESMTSYVEVVPNSSSGDWSLAKTSFSEVWDVPQNEDWPMFGFASTELDVHGDPLDFIQIEANPHRQLEIFMRANGGDEQYLTIGNMSEWVNGSDWWVYWNTDKVAVLGNGGDILFRSDIDTTDSFGDSWAIPTVSMHLQAEVGENGGMSFDDMELRGNIIPEPATLVLLGLGGIILRRGKR